MKIEFGTYAYAEKDNRGKLLLHINDCKVIHPELEYYGEIVIKCETSFLDELSYSEFTYYFGKYRYYLSVFHTGGTMPNQQLLEDNRTLAKNTLRFIKRHESKIDIDIEI